MDLLTDIRESPMSRFQVVGIAVALSLFFVDGIDVAVMSYVAPALSREWETSPVLLGYLLSAGLFGMAAGSFLLTPLADRIGRRKLTLASLTVATIGTALCVVAADVPQLVAFRVLTGIGVGGMMANLNVLVSEYASNRRRGAIIGLYSAGYPIGATLGGLAAALVIPTFGWHALFAVAALLSAVLLLISARLLPESLDYLLTRQPNNALERVNAILARMHRQPITQLPDLPDTRGARSPWREVLTGSVGVRTVLLWIGYSLVLAAYYFATTWIPKIMAGTTGDDALGVRIGLVFNIGGIVGCLMFGALALRFRSLPILVGALTLAAVSFAAFGSTLGAPGVAATFAVFMGTVTACAVSGYYAISPGLYSPRSRSTGMGMAIGVGRVASILAPIVVGYLLGGGLTPRDLFLVFAAPLVAAVLATVALGVSQRRHPAATLMDDTAGERRRSPDPRTPAADGAA